MAEIVYRPVVWTALTAFKLLDLRFRVEGAERVPRTGGAVLVSNHVSYLDFILAGLAALPSGRLVRFMAKKEVFDNRIAGPLMRGMHHISVDRSAGVGAFREAVRALESGEIVGNFAEATISRSFTIGNIKSGPIRMASDAGVPMIPVALWGGQRLWTKGRPRKLLQRHIPVAILVGDPMHPSREDDVAKLTTQLRERMCELVDQAQRTYPDRADGAWWQPAHLGGSAPTPEEALALETAARARRSRA
jgi:1-acyl-sn-glycerol-3-phosphate acyltransferase